MGADRYNKTDRLGVNAFESVVVNELEWTFREQLVADMGIDAQLELWMDHTDWQTDCRSDQDGRESIS